MPMFRSLLFVPGNNERMIERAPAAGADAIVLDLEDAVPDGEKRAARALVRRAAPRIAAAGVPVLVRVNGISSGRTRDDVMAAVSRSLAGVVLPKTESAQDLRDLDVMLREAELKRRVRPGDVRTIALIESAAGVLRCEEIARASDRLLALSAGAEDYVYDIGAPRDARALQHMRGVIVQVAAAYHLAPIDTPYPDHRDRAGLEAEAELARAVGFKGKYAIHPAQIAPIHAIFTPSPAEVAYARRVVEAYDAAVAGGIGAVNVDGRMVDAPIAEHARALIGRAEEITRPRGRSRAKRG